MRTTCHPSAVGAPTALLAALVALVALAGATLVAPATPAAADSCDGVWVVVDARELGGGTSTRCAPGNPSSGLDALRAAGFSYSFVPRQPGMVCTIDQRPDPCNGAPSHAYWSYWHAPAGGSWTYSSSGAGQRDPQPGTVDGWAFGAGDPPSQPPPAAPAADEPSGADTGGTGDSGGEGSTGSRTGGSSGSNSSGSGTSDGSATGGTTGSSSGTTSSGASGSSPSPDDGGSSSTGGDGADRPADDADPEAAAGQGDDDERRRDDDTNDRDESDDEEPDESDADGPRHEIAERAVGDSDDVVALEGANRSGGRGASGVLLGGTLVTAIAGAAALRSRRRASLDG